MVGWHMSVAINFNASLGLVADFAGQYHNTDFRWWLSDDTVRLEEYQMMIGPKICFRDLKKLTPFAHILLGVAARHYTTPSDDSYHPLDVLAVDYGFATALGGGFDIPLSKRWAVHAFQFDYILTHLKPDLPEYSPIRDQLPDLEQWQHNYRISCGFVARFGWPP